MEASEQRARAAILNAARHVPMVEPLSSMLLRARRDLEQVWEPGALVSHWQARSVGNLAGSDRYRWELTHQRGTGFPDYAGPPEAWRPWRSSETAVASRDVFAFEERLTGPIVAFESAELLAEARSQDCRADELLGEAEPVLRRDLAQCALERNAWADTFAAWCLTRYPSTFARILPVLIAVVETYTTRARGSAGIVHGTRYPLHEQPLVSASAQLGATLLAVGSHFDVAAQAIGFVSSQLREDGGWGDSRDPSDVLTTLVASDLLSSSDPNFDPLPTRRFFESRQLESGFWRALGPEMPWLSFSILRWLEASHQSFAWRFRWPKVQSANLDRKTGLPFFVYFADAARLFETLPGLRQASVDIAFMDLIGFRDFNNRFGQARGDDVLAVFASLLSELAVARPVRDGGDEFLLLGAPTSHDLYDRLARLLEAWPERFRRHFGAEAPPVLARALVGRTNGAGLLAAREALGRGIAELKHERPDPTLGILREIELTTH